MFSTMRRTNWLLTLLISSHLMTLIASQNKKPLRDISKFFLVMANTHKSFLLETDERNLRFYFIHYKTVIRRRGRSLRVKNLKTGSRLKLLTRRDELRAPASQQTSDNW